MALLRNDSPQDHGWVRFKLRGTDPNRHAIGAEVTLTVAGNVHQRTVMPTRSYLSQVELPLTFGLGDEEQVDSVAVRWPNGGHGDLAQSGDPSDAHAARRQR